MKLRLLGVLIGSGLLMAAATGGYLLFERYFGRDSSSNAYISRWLSDPAANLTLQTEGRIQCPGAPFIVPSSGFIGLLWRDPAGPYSMVHRHTGLDIFGYGAAGTIPVYAAYEGYLSRLEDWHSTVIIRHADPLEPGRTIWTYYTHMASRDGGVSYVDDAFPAGTYGLFVPQGTLLGYQGAYNPQFPIAMHVHFSIVLSEDDGSFMNEAILSNTLDPSPYLGMTVDFEGHPARPVQCLVEE